MANSGEPQPTETSVEIPPQAPAAAAQSTTGLEAEADDRLDDNDSSLGDDESLASSMTSISSSILKHRVENGRTYHAYKDGKYLYPNDESENDRLDLQHHIYSLMNGGKLFTCPIAKDKSIHRVLDVGTGTGIWAMDYGDEHPEATVFGVDLSPIQPTFLPPNVIFQIDDIEEPWAYSQKFDFIYARMMTGSLSNWPKFFDSAYENITPGGYIELTDVTLPIGCDDGTLTPDHALHQWSELILSASVKIGRPINSAKSYKAQMEHAGFTGIHETADLWPTNKWPKDPNYKELGLWNCENLTQGLSGLSMALLTRVHNWSMEEVEAFLVNVRKELKDPKIHSYLPM
ncbi:S-adenosyl-L-methionine-dependent methyltransferase [Venustampulla echinocandica]|uniref:S-adenosyl-L-methionine-dependent methyltransferase n=1 Tax=Venustampulla echinocandica TaxID=2656787 RepID=A0A370TB55_9HELO|nr:S-adenosyl-L-methionine-dependent methyltransferase [Venustampulla echinocandica]RDL31152.1 S-adenosyl-L-methionine-dependent methyltransferase [Venustampulla echinocandica]